MGFKPCIIGVSWLAVEITSSLPSLLTTKKAQPEPKRVVAAAVNASLKAANEPNVASISAANSADISVFSGESNSQKRA